MLYYATVFSLSQLLQVNSVLSVKSQTPQISPSYFYHTSSAFSISYSLGLLLAF